MNQHLLKSNLEVIIRFVFSSETERGYSQVLHRSVFSSGALPFHDLVLIVASDQPDVALMKFYERHSLDWMQSRLERKMTQPDYSFHSCWISHMPI